MINLYTGTPGSGKSLNIARFILIKLRVGIDVIGTMVVNQDVIKGRKGKYIYVNIYELSPVDLIAYARKFHKKGKEGQTLIVIDEAQLIFNSRDWSAHDRRAWNDFFQLHRHFGYNITLITQFDRLLDRQLRALVEYQYIHRKISNFGLKGMLLSMFFLGGLFISVGEWYPMREKISSDFFVYRKKYSNFYDSYATFDNNNNDVDSFNQLKEYI